MGDGGSSWSAAGQPIPDSSPGHVADRRPGVSPTCSSPSLATSPAAACRTCSDQTGVAVERLCARSLGRPSARPGEHRAGVDRRADPRRLDDLAALLPAGWELDDGSTSSTSPWLCPCGDTTEPNAAHSWPSAMGTAAGGPQCRREAASALRGQPSPVHTVLLPRGGGVRPSWSSPPWITHGALRGVLSGCRPSRRCSGHRPPAMFLIFRRADALGDRSRR